MAEYVLTLSCPDRVGIVHAVAAYLHEAGCNVLDSQQFGDRIAGRFFMRVHVETVPGAPATYDSLYGGLFAVAAEFGMEWELHDTAVQPRVLIMVSKAGHCLNDLLYRRAAESLRIDVPLVVGNRPDLAPLAAAHGVLFEHVPAGPEDLAAIGRDAERVALARAVRWHAEHRVLLHGRRTVIFR
jgi:formyltetrahydrofolate deformylase